MWLIAISSLVFYGFWKPAYVLLLVFAAVMDFYLANRIHRTTDAVKKRFLLIVSLALNLGLLFYFKYLVFFKENLEDVLNIFGKELVLLPGLQILLPIGISFYTFETISYIVDVYRKHITPEKDFIHYLSFLVFFPHLIAGPVLRAAQILPQFNEQLKFRQDDFLGGVKKLLTGLFLKVVLADNIAPLVDAGFNMPSLALSALDIWTLAFLFGFQIYFDFCAYSFIAIGAAKMMGIHFPENFNFPYLAVSPRAFWKRWHISLSTWIRDYVYLPLAGRTVNFERDEAVSEIQNKHNFRGFSALFITWALMGFWHGANWTFVIWGLYHACLVMFHRLSSRYTRNLNQTFLNVSGWAISLPLLMLGWIPFRVTDLNTVWNFCLTLTRPSAYAWLGMKENIYLVTFLLLFFIVLVYLADRYLLPAIENSIAWKACSFLGRSVMIALVIVFLKPISQFIYFQF